MGSRFTPTGLPWVRPDGVQLSSAASMFLLGAVNLNFDVSPNRYADGTLADVSVLVGTATWDEVGTAAASCSDYTSTSGSGMLLDTRSSRKLDIRSLGPSSCSASRLLCLQD